MPTPVAAVLIARIYLSQAFPIFRTYFKDRELLNHPIQQRPPRPKPIVSKARRAPLSAMQELKREWISLS